MNETAPPPHHQHQDHHGTPTAPSNALSGLCLPSERLPTREDRPHHHFHGVMPMQQQQTPGIRAEEEWTDVTPFLSGVAREDAQAGEMIHGAAFDLYDIMSAMEIGDPKMDVSAPPAVRVKSVEERLREAEGGAQASVLHMLCTVERVEDRALLVSLMERMLRAEATWFSGQTLPQTVLTCLPLFKLDAPSAPVDADVHTFVDGANGERTYAVDDPSSYYVRDPFLRQYLVAVIKCVDIIKEGTVSIEVRDDEELFTNPFGFDMRERESGDAVVDELDRLETELSEEVEEMQDDGEKEVTNALIGHLLFRKLFLSLLLRIQDKKLGKVKKDLSQLREKALPAIRSRFSIQNDSHASDDGAVGFDTEYCRRVSCPTPLKPLDHLSFEDTMQQFEALFDDLVPITTLYQLSPSLHALLAFMEEYSHRNAHVIARSFLWNLIAYKDGKALNGRIVKDMVVKHVLDTPALKRQHVDAVLGRVKEPEMDTWLKELEQIYVGLVSVLCHNKSRLRRKLRHLIVIAGQAEHRAEQIDINCFNSKPPHKEENFILSYFTIDLILRMMNMFLTLGFELDLYHVVDYLPVFWYLEYTTSISVTNIQKLFLSGEKKGKKKAKRSMDFAAREALTELGNVLSRANVRFLLGLLKLGYTINVEAFGFKLGSERLRFVQRFSPFHHINQPPPVSFEQYQQFIASFDPLDAMRLFQGAAEHFQAAIRLCDKLLSTEHRKALTARCLETVQGYRTVAQQNSVTARVSAAKYIAQRRKGTKEDATATAESESTRKLPQFDFSHSSLYPIIKPM